MNNNRTIWLLFILTLVILGAIKIQGQPLVTPSAPKGILSLEFSANSTSTEAIRKEWSGSIREVFYLNMIIDYFFLLIYGSFFYYASVWLAKQKYTPSKLGIGAAWAGLVAAGFDALENLLMILSISFGARDTQSFITVILASVKFFLIAFSILYILFAVGKGLTKTIVSRS